MTCVSMRPATTSLVRTTRFNLACVSASGSASDRAQIPLGQSNRTTPTCTNARQSIHKTHYTACVIRDVSRPRLAALRPPRVRRLFLMSSVVCPHTHHCPHRHHHHPFRAARASSYILPPVNARMKNRVSDCESTSGGVNDCGDSRHAALVCDRPVRGHPRAFRGHPGYVPVHDRLHNMLTSAHLLYWIFACIRVNCMRLCTQYMAYYAHMHVHVMAGRFEATPGRFEATPGRFEATPGRFEATPGMKTKKCQSLRCAQIGALE